MQFDKQNSHTTRRIENEFNHSSKLPQAGYVPPEKIPEPDDPEFLGDKAWDWAIFITKAQWNDRFGRFESRNKITTHQIRRYYGEFKSIERSFGDEPSIEKWSNGFHKIKLIMAKAVYDSNRTMNKLPKEFESFITKSIQCIPSDHLSGFKKFKNICLLFEAVVGYSSQYTRE